MRNMEMKEVEGNAKFQYFDVHNRRWTDKIEATFENDTVWLSIDQMAELFQRDRSVIGKHVRNIFKEGELNKESVWAKFAYTAVDGNRMNCCQM